MTIPVLWNPKETSQKIRGASVMTLAIWRCHGVGPPYIKVGRRVFYAEADVATWLATRRRTPRRAKGKAA
jgi:hypothetical protein